MFPSAPNKEISKISVPDLLSMKEKNQKISMLTAYDYLFASLIDEAGIDAVLVGDSLGMVIQGHLNTLGVTLEQMIYHTQCVGRALKRAHLVCDMPFLSYQISVEESLKNCGRVLKESPAQAVKLEGGLELVETIKQLTQTGIPVMGHIGLKPTHVHQMGGYKIQGKDPKSQKQILEEALGLEKAGCYSIVLEGIPASLGKKISKSLKIPCIGIGSGPNCDGQVLVLQDILGLNPNFKPKFVKRYADLSQEVNLAVKNYIQEVKSQKFPSEKESF